MTSIECPAKGMGVSNIKFHRPNIDVSSFGGVRALALGNANAKSKENLVFLSPNPSASENGIQQYFKFYCNTATVQF